MSNGFRVVSFWADGWRQVEGFYNSLREAQEAIQEYEQNSAPDYRGCRVFQDFRNCEVI